MGSNPGNTVSAIWHFLTLCKLSSVMPLAGGLNPEFGFSVNPIPTRGEDYAYHITDCPPGFKNLTASLVIVTLHNSMYTKFDVHIRIYIELIFQSVKNPLICF